jgi:hypothetical protein
MQQSDVLGCAIGRWTLIWGDPLLAGSVSMLLYGLAGMLLLRVARRSGTRDRRLWGVCAALFFFQVLNTHLDLHALPTAFGHCLAQAQGWYENRGAVKLLGLVLIGVAMALVLIVAAFAWWRSIRANTMLVAGVAIALGFTLIKGTAVNVAEEVYHRMIGPFRWVDLAEFGGVALAMLAAARRLRSLRRRPALRPGTAG